MTPTQRPRRSRRHRPGQRIRTQLRIVLRESPGLADSYRHLLPTPAPLRRGAVLMCVIAKVVRYG